MSIDEALRALEKKWRRIARDCHGTFTSDAYTDAADELAALLTTRQEVAPVALPHPLGERHAEIEAALKGQTLLLMSRDHINDKKKPLAEIKFGMYTELGVLFCLADTEASMPVDTTTGQTSDARDALREAVRALLDSAPPHMTPRNAKEREAYKMLRSIMKEAT